MKEDILQRSKVWDKFNLCRMKLSAEDTEKLFKQGRISDVILVKCNDPGVLNMSHDPYYLVMNSIGSNILWWPIFTVRVKGVPHVNSIGNN